LGDRRDSWDEMDKDRRDRVRMILRVRKIGLEELRSKKSYVAMSRCHR
jgi:hypothetical protein